tara:strand:- start:120 stop:362 length:243 start_codon:yes stop_codon:yes gene_type:complete
MVMMMMMMMMMMNEDNKMEEKTKRRFQIFNLRFDDIGCPKISFWVKIFPSYTKARPLVTGPKFFAVFFRLLFSSFSFSKF